MVMWGGKECFHPYRPCSGFRFSGQVGDLTFGMWYLRVCCRDQVLVCCRRPEFYCSISGLMGPLGLFGGKWRGRRLTWSGNTVAADSQQAWVPASGAWDSSEGRGAAWLQCRSGRLTGQWLLSSLPRGEASADWFWIGKLWSIFKLKAMGLWSLPLVFDRVLVSKGGKLDHPRSQIRRYLWLSMGLCWTIAFNVNGFDAIDNHQEPVRDWISCDRWLSEAGGGHQEGAFFVMVHQGTISQKVL